VLEEAFLDSGRALDEGDFTRSLLTSCSVLEAIITDALQHRGSSALRDPLSDLTRFSFDERIAAAEQCGLIRGGCARLPPLARTYRDAADTDRGASERDAKLTRQVLHVVMRDLDPGR
jgi:hypothetical protein